MEERNYWTDLMRSRLSRRRFLRNGAIAGLGLAALSSNLACSSGGTQTPKTESDQPKYGGYINTWHSTDPPHFDPHTTVSWAMWQPMGMIYSNLIRFKFGPAVRPDELIYEGDLAEKWENPDPLTYVFNLHKGVKWQDGSDFSAEDIKYSIERIKYFKEAVRSYMYDAVDKVEVVDHDTVKFKFKNPSAAFLTFLSIPFSMIVSAKYTEKDPENLKKQPMGTGPFILDSYERNVKMTFKKNPNFFKQGLPYVDGVYYYIISDVSTRYSMFVSKQIDVFNQDAEQEVQLKQDVPDVMLDSYGSTGWGNRVRQLVDRPPFNDKKVRNAVNLAIDRHAMIASQLKPEDYRMIGVLPWTDPFVLPQEEILKLPGFRTDRDKEIKEAKDLMAAAGYANGFKVKLDGQVTYNPEKYLSQIKEYLKVINIDADTRINEYAPFKKMEYDKTYEGLLLGAYVAYFDPDEYVYAFFHSKSPTNNLNVVDTKLDAMLEKQSAELNREERKKQLWDIQRYLLDQNYDYGFIAGVSRTAWHPYLKNYRYHSVVYTGRNYENVWLDK